LSIDQEGCPTSGRDVRFRDIRDRSPIPPFEARLAIALDEQRKRVPNDDGGATALPLRDEAVA
jgi:hypothetical protein